MKETYTQVNIKPDEIDTVMVCTYGDDIVLAVNSVCDGTSRTWLTIAQAHQVIEHLYKAIIDVQLVKAGLSVEQP